MGDADHTQSTSRAQEGKRAQEGNEHKKATSTSDAREQLGSRVMERALRAELYSVRTESCVARASSSRHVSVSGVRIFVAQESD